MFNVYKNQLSRQTGSRSLTGQKTLPTKWGTNMKLVTKYQISANNICWEKCDEKLAYMFNVYKHQLSQQTGSRNLTGQKTLPTIWGTYMKLATKYQISAIDSCWEKCETDGQTHRGKTVYPPPPSGSGGIIYRQCMYIVFILPMSKRPKQLPNCLKRTETKSCSNHFPWCRLSYHNTKAGHKEVQCRQVFLYFNNININIPCT